MKCQSKNTLIMNIYVKRYLKIKWLLCLWQYEKKYMQFYIDQKTTSIGLGSVSPEIENSGIGMVKDMCISCISTGHCSPNRVQSRLATLLKSIFIFTFFSQHLTCPDETNFTPQLYSITKSIVLKLVMLLVMTTPNNG